MSQTQKMLKAFSLAIMGFGILDLIAGIFMVVAAPLAAGTSFEVAGELADGPDASVILGIVGIVVGVYCVVTGIVGARTANNPRNIGAFQRFDILLVLAVFIELVGAVLSGHLTTLQQASWADIALLVLGILASVYAVKANKEALDR